MDRTYGFNKRTGDYVYRIPGHRHGDGQVDSDDRPVWLLTDADEAEAACNGDVPNINPDECEPRPDPLVERLEQCGQALFGARWQSELARALSVGDRRVREWAAEDRSIPAGVWTDIAALLRDRCALCATLVDEIDGSR